jgi:inner membrane protein
MERGYLSGSAFGVELLAGVDAYDMAWRAVRYGLMFIIVPFAVLFLFELLSRSRIHPVQYVLIGLANCIFYLLLLSLSEVIGFGWAYALAALACAGLCGTYTMATLRSKRGLLMLPALGLLYAYLYVALSSEDYALLIGSLGLLALLAAAMALTRKIDWYGSRAPLKAARESDAADGVRP